jgi:hypothetical protein
MKDLINKEICDQYELTMMVYLLQLIHFHFLYYVLLFSSLMVIETTSTVSFPF